MSRPTGPGKTEKARDPLSLLLYNFDIGGSNLKEEHRIFLREEAFPILKAGGSVRVIGLTDRQGTDANNLTLSKQRVASTVVFLKKEISNRFIIKEEIGVGETVAAEEGDKDNTKNEKFRAVRLSLYITPIPPPVEPPKSVPTMEERLVYRRTYEEKLDINMLTVDKLDNPPQLKIGAMVVTIYSDVLRMRQHPIEAGDPDPGKVEEVKFEQVDKAYIMTLAEVNKIATVTYIKGGPFYAGYHGYKYDIIRQYVFKYGPRIDDNHVSVKRHRKFIRNGKVDVDEYDHIVVPQPENYKDP